MGAEVASGGKVEERSWAGEILRLKSGSKKV